MVIFIEKSLTNIAFLIENFLITIILYWGWRSAQLLRALAKFPEDMDSQYPCGSQSSLPLGLEDLIPSSQTLGMNTVY